MNSQASNLQPAPFPGITSLGTLREQHSALLQRARTRHRNGESNKEDRTTPEEMLGFIQAAASLGSTLPDDDNRDTAQGMIDYWVGFLLSVTPEAIDQSKYFTLAPFDAPASAAISNEAAVEESRIEATCKKGDALVKKLDPAQRAAMDEIMLRLFRLKEGGSDPYPYPLQKTDSLLAKPSYRELVGKLVEADIIQKRPNSAGSDAFELSSPRFLTRWAPLKEVVVDRKAFRLIATGWHNGGQDPTALLGKGAKYDQGDSYPGKNEIEDQFLKASRGLQQERDTKERTRTKRIIGVLGTVLALAITLICILIYTTHEERVQRRKANDQEKEATLQREYAEQQNAQLQLTIKDFLEAQAATKKVQEQYEITLKQKDEVVKAANEQLRQLTENLQKAPENRKTTVEEAQQAQKDFAETIKKQEQSLPPGPTAPPPSPDGLYNLKGTAFVLEPQTNPQIKDDETLALLRSYDGAPNVFLSNVDRTKRPLLSQLDPDAKWVTARWDYTLTPRKWLITHQATIVNPANGKSIKVYPVDWGHMPGHAFNISPGVAKFLGANPEDELQLSIPTQPPPAVPSN
ncbi:MAG: hypothetical protein QM755_02460 [Luteolibacter sp.]